MRVAVFTEPHRGAGYDDQLRFARTLEAAGFEGFLRADHYQAMGAEPGLPGPTDAWLTLAATYSFLGDHYRLVDAPALPKPVQQPGPPVIVGGRGPRRTPELAARYADEFNMPFKSVAETAASYDRVIEACDRHGRTDSGRAPLVLSAGIVVAIGGTDAEVRERAAPLHRMSALPPEDPVIGSPAQLVDRIGEFAAVGAARVHLRLADLADLAHLELIAAEVLPQL
ncbi:LLM class flavin-dependent oxidoreductase [Micromonospora sp. NPDC002296]|uniref:LLM class flavin-dependent oxidoreductase n=1 Tax=Micromonospora sp. NPDC002296 TaxID=3154271 RepID=UPI003331BBFE